MARIRLLTGNLVTEDATTIAANSVNALFPVLNIKDSRTTKEFRTATGTTTAVVTFDFKTTESVTDVAISENSVAGFSITGTVTVEANIIDSWASPAFSTTLSLNAKFGLGHVSFPSESYRFWRVTATNTVDFAALSNIFIGANLLESPFERNINFGWTFLNKANTKFQRNRYLQKFFDKINTERQFKGTFENLSKADYESLQDAFDEHGLDRPIWLIPDPNESFSTNKERFGGHYYLNSVPQAKNTSFARYQLNMSLREAL